MEWMMRVEHDGIWQLPHARQNDRGYMLKSEYSYITILLNQCVPWVSVLRIKIK